MDSLILDQMLESHDYVPVDVNRRLRNRVYLHEEGIEREVFVKGDIRAIVLRPYLPAGFSYLRLSGDGQQERFLNTLDAITSRPMTELDPKEMMIRIGLGALGFFHSQELGGALMGFLVLSGYLKALEEFTKRTNADMRCYLFPGEVYGRGQLVTGHDAIQLAFRLDAEGLSEFYRSMRKAG